MVCARAKTTSCQCRSRSRGSAAAGENLGLGGTTTGALQPQLAFTPSKQSQAKQKTRPWASILLLQPCSRRSETEHSQALVPWPSGGSRRVPAGEQPAVGWEEFATGRQREYSRILIHGREVQKAAMGDAEGGMGGLEDGGRRGSDDAKKRRRTGKMESRTVEKTPAWMGLGIRVMKKLSSCYDYSSGLKLKSGYSPAATRRSGLVAMNLPSGCRTMPGCLMLRPEQRGLSSS